MSLLRYFSCSVCVLICCKFYTTFYHNASRYYLNMFHNMILLMFYFNSIRKLWTVHGLVFFSGYGLMPFLVTCQDLEPSTFMWIVLFLWARDMSKWFTLTFHFELYSKDLIYLMHVCVYVLLSIMFVYFVHSCVLCIYVGQ